jgi:insecticidal toxin
MLLTKTFVYRPGGDPSPDILGLKNNAEHFLKQHPVGSENIGPFHSRGSAKLVKSRPWNSVPSAVYNVQAAATHTSNTADAYFLGYRSVALQGNMPAYRDIPQHDTEGMFLFTGELSGCSVVVTKLNEHTYRVHHDSRFCASALYDNVVMSIDYLEYHASYEDKVRRKIAVATALMQFKGNHWTLYTQCLNENQQNSPLAANEVPESKRVLRWKDNSPVIVKTSNRPINIVEYRDRLYHYLHEVAKQFIKNSPIHVRPDGEFVSFNPANTPVPTLNNPAVARTASLRAILKQHDVETQLREQVKRLNDKYHATRSTSKSCFLFIIWLLNLICCTS